jgi:hypothetical protein
LHETLHGTLQAWRNLKSFLVSSNQPRLFSRNPDDFAGPGEVVAIIGG